jgi:hypothetical protein
VTKNQKPESRQFEPPGDLSPRSIALWRHLVPGRCRSTGRLVTLHAALKALDRAAEYEAIVAREGIMPKQPASLMAHMHPLLKAAEESRREWRTLWTSMDLQTGKLDLVPLEFAMKQSNDLGLPATT